jgi:hypothetical protein
MVTFHAICLHPSLVRVNGDPGNDHPAALEMNEKQHVVGHQPAQRQHLRGEEVRRRQQRQVNSNVRRPGCAPNPFVPHASRFAIDFQKILARATRRGHAGNGKLTIFSTVSIF